MVLLLNKTVMIFNDGGNHAHPHAEFPGLQSGGSGWRGAGPHHLPCLFPGPLSQFKDGITARGYGLPPSETPRSHDPVKSRKRESAAFRHVVLRNKTEGHQAVLQPAQNTLDGEKIIRLFHLNGNGAVECAGNKGVDALNDPVQIHRDGFDIPVTGEQKDAAVEFPNLNGGFFNMVDGIIQRVIRRQFRFN